jgi:hypothetical protein
MKTRYGIVAVALVASLALAGPSLGAGKGQAAQNQTRSMNPSQKQQRVQDGSCIQSGTSQGAKSKSGNTHGPGNGTGNQGVGPKDGTGYGAPVNR